MSTAGNATVCHGIIEDLDITGVGVRSTFYVTSMLLGQLTNFLGKSTIINGFYLVVNACIPGCDVRGPFWTLDFTSLALLVSALIQTVNKTISFYNAILVIFLCFLHSFSSLFVLNILHWVHRKKMDAILSLISLLQLLVLYMFTILVLGLPNSFGSQPECNSRVDVTLLLIFWATMIVILVFLDHTTTSVRYILGRFKRTRHIISIISINGELQTFFRDHEWKVGLPLFVAVWVSMVVSIEKAILNNSIIHDGPRFTASFGQIFPVVTIGIPISSIYSDVRAWLRRRTVKETPPMAAQDTQSMSAVVYDNDAYLAPTLALPPVDTEITASTIMMPPGDETEKPLDIMFGEVHMQTHSNTTSTLPPASVTEITTSTTPPGDEQDPTLDVIGSGQTDEVDVRAPDSETKTPEDKVPTTPN
ncbi:hypothetical protein K443DRAFT_5746 [Laccaria amethystina LaAM-08-1]|uniref:Uncharacterized protein n=1 Tax=Laccaria amethystina LaAM-08-1 TaxID=1095629 RepID=A0A0C9WUT9_9AGAR|nr:hypothetical protein K443DRAFT_5746 [Laccaria amethystina LaAM-08-1]